MEAGGLCRTCRLRPPPSVFWFLFHAEKELAPLGEILFGTKKGGGGAPPPYGILLPMLAP